MNQIFAALVVALLVAVANGRAPKKIVGGSLAAPGEFPYQVSLRTNGAHFCGGAIISQRHIITAAHCFNSISPSTVTVATGTTSSRGGEIHRVRSVVSHPMHTSEFSSPYDVAIITLADEIIFNRNQNKIALPTAPTPPGADAIATGWGYRNKLLKQVAPDLWKVQLKTIPVDECQLRIAPTATIYQSQICTYVGRGLGTCQGDSGGPLASNGVLVGLVSWGVPCAEGLPDMFTSVYHYLDWIHQNMNSNYYW